MVSIGLSAAESRLQVGYNGRGESLYRVRGREGRGCRDGDNLGSSHFQFESKEKTAFDQRGWLELVEGGYQKVISERVDGWKKRSGLAEGAIWLGENG